MIKKVTPSEKKKLKERLRKLDRELSGLYYHYKYTFSPIYSQFSNDRTKLIKLDQKRLEIRNKLKGY